MSDRKAEAAPNGAIKDPADWTTDDEPMTGAQESYLHTLARQAGEEDEVPDALRKKTGTERVAAKPRKSARRA